MTLPESANSARDASATLLTEYSSTYVSAGAGSLPDYLDGLERKAILETLARTGFNRTAAAKLLGITFRQLRYRMQRLGIREEDKA